MPLFTFRCSNSECLHEREVLCKVSERESLMEWCTKCEVVTSDVSAVIAADNLNEPDTRPRVTEEQVALDGSGVWKIQALMRWVGVETATLRLDGKFQMKAVMENGQHVAGKFGHRAHKRSDW